MFDIIEALADLVESGEDIVFDLVGWPENGDPILQEIVEKAKQHGLAERVQYHGRKAVGPELFDYYRRADIFVNASKSSFEGFPRTIWEAMAHSLPVLATKVGSIPQFIAGAAELVEPNDVHGLGQAIRTLIQSSIRRQELIQAGRSLASGVTLEKQVGKMVDRIRQWIQKQK